MSDFTLKEGDFVYIPSACSTAQKVKSVKGTNLFKANCYTFFDSGYIFGSVARPAGKIVFPATQEWYDKLVVIYPNLEKPPKRKDPKEIIQAMLDFGYHGVPCKTECGCARYICIGIGEDNRYPFRYEGDEGGAYESGIPYHPRTGLKIVDFIDGKCILENGEVILKG